MKPPSRSSRLNTQSRYNSDPDESPHDSPPDSSSNGNSPYDGDSSLSSRSPPRSFSVAVDEPSRHPEPIHQPLDVGVNKPLKKLVREQWEDWML